MDVHRQHAHVALADRRSTSMVRTAEQGTAMTQPDGIHTIPVPKGWSIDKAWDWICIGGTMSTYLVDWTNVEIRNGRIVSSVVLP